MAKRWLCAPVKVALDVPKDVERQALCLPVGCLALLPLGVRQLRIECGAHLLVPDSPLHLRVPPNVLAHSERLDVLSPIARHVHMGPRHRHHPPPAARSQQHPIARLGTPAGSDIRHDPVTPAPLLRLASRGAPMLAGCAHPALNPALGAAGVLAKTEGCPEPYLPHAREQLVLRQVRLPQNLLLQHSLLPL